MLEAMAHFNLDAFTHYFSVGEVMGPYSRPSVSQSYVLDAPTASGWRCTCRRPRSSGRAWPLRSSGPTCSRTRASPTREARIDHQEDLIEVLGGIFAHAHPRRVVPAGSRPSDVPHAPMYDTAEALEDPQAQHLQLLVSASTRRWATFRTVRPPVSFDGERALDVRPPPMLGEHNGDEAWPKGGCTHAGGPIGSLRRHRSAAASAAMA